MYVPCQAPHAPGCRVTLLGWAGRSLYRLVAVGVAYIRSTPCETKRPTPGTIKYIATRSLLHALAESHTTHSQTNLHTSGVAGALGHTVRGLSADCGQSYQPLRPQSPSIKKRKGRTFSLIFLLSDPVYYYVFCRKGIVCDGDRLPSNVQLDTRYQPTSIQIC